MIGTLVTNRVDVVLAAFTRKMTATKLNETLLLYPIELHIPQGRDETRTRNM
jgi:hypothetical protein